MCTMPTQVNPTAFLLATADCIRVVLMGPTCELDLGQGSSHEVPSWAFESSDPEGSDIW
jgi:hypothetical protein